MQYLFFPEIEALQQNIKTYLALSPFSDQTELLKLINAQRLKIALDACQRMIFYDQTLIQGNAANETSDNFFQRGDIKSILKRGIASLEQNVTVSLTHQGVRQNVFTREPIAWQQLFSAVQLATASANGQNIPFDYPSEIYFNENESFQMSVINQRTDGFIFHHGCNLIDNSVNLADLQKEIQQSELPQTAYVPLIYQFVGAADTYAEDGQGKNVIYSTKSDRSVILTHVSVADSNADDEQGGLDCRLTLIDEGRNQEICNLVEMRGIAGAYISQYTTYYPLPYPLLLPRQDRLKARILNGSDITTDFQTQDETNFLNFAGFTI